MNFALIPEFFFSFKWTSFFNWAKRKTKKKPASIEVERRLSLK